MLPVLKNALLITLSSSFLFDAMAQCGTTTCLTVLFQTMEAKKMEKEAMKFMSYLAFLKEPTPEVIRMLMVSFFYCPK